MPHEPINPIFPNLSTGPGVGGLDPVSNGQRMKIEIDDRLTVAYENGTWVLYITATLPCGTKSTMTDEFGSLYECVCEMMKRGVYDHEGSPDLRLMVHHVWVLLGAVIEKLSDQPGYKRGFYPDW